MSEQVTSAGSERVSSTMEEQYSAAGASPNAPERMRLCERAFARLEISPARILDVGGSAGTSGWLAETFPEATISVLNSNERERDSLRPGIGFEVGNAERFTVAAPVDLLYAGELLEHLFSPDGFLESATRAIAPGGWLVVTTPNLACLANRVFLGLGWTPGNISPSIRYITGNPMLPEGSGRIGTIAFHKSVFTLRGLRRLLELYGFSPRMQLGYSYAPEPGQRRLGLGGREVASAGYGVRRLLNRALPHSLREGMAIFARHWPKARTAPPLTYPDDVPNLPGGIS